MSSSLVVPRRAAPFSRTRLSVVLLALIALAVWSMPAASRQDPAVTFAAFGDFGKAGAGELAVANLVKSWNPDFIVALGDNNYEYGEASTIDANIGQYYHSFIYPYVGSYGAGATVNRFFPALGNHDWGDGYIWPPTVQPHYDYFTLPGNERYYDVVWGPVHLFALDSDYHEPDGTSATSVQAQWLQSRLTASTATWKVVYFHHPAYSSGARAPQEFMRWPFREWGATVVMVGHHHHYERILVENLPHFVSGLGGNGTGDLSFPIAGSRMRYRDALGSMRVSATSGELRLDFVNVNNDLVDSYAIAAPSGPGAPHQLVATAVPVGRIDLWWTDNASDETGFSIERSNDGTTFSALATVAANVSTYTDQNVDVTPTTYYYRVRAQTDTSFTGYSNVATAQTVPPTPDAPVLQTSSANTSSVRLSWNADSSSAGTNLYRMGTTYYLAIGSVGAGVTEFIDTGRTPAATYTYVARAVNAGGESPSSNESTVTVDKLATPTGVTAAAVSTSQINISWVDNSTGENYFKVLRSTNGTSFTVVAWVAANGTTYADTGRTAGTTYYYRIQAYENGGGVSDLSEIVSATTLVVNNPPAPASNLSATIVSSSQIDLAWTDGSTNETGFRIERSASGGSFVPLVTLVANVVSHSDTGLTGGVTYAYRVISFNDQGSAAASNTVSVKTPASNFPAPSNLSAVATAARSVTLTWQDNTSNEASFKVYRATDGVNYTFIGTAAANATTYTNGTPEPATTYQYLVYAYHSSGASSLPSNTAVVTTPSVPAPPSGLAGTAPSSTQVRLTWTDNSQDETHFRIDRSTNGTSFSTAAWVSSNITTYTDSGRKANTTYYYRVASYNANGSSAPSNVVTVTPQ